MKYDKWNDVSLDEWKEIMCNHSENYDRYYDCEEKRISQLNDKESKLQYIQLAKVQDEMLELEELEIERNKKRIKEILKSEGITWRKSRFSLNKMREKWKLSFASHLNTMEQKECHLNEFLWTVFTFNKISNYLVGDFAERAFDNEKKNGIYIFGEGLENVYHLNANDFLRAKHFRFELGNDIYIVDDKFTWTLASSHSLVDWIWYKKESERI